MSRAPRKRTDPAKYQAGRFREGNGRALPGPEALGRIQGKALALADSGRDYIHHIGTNEGPSDRSRYQPTYSDSGSDHSRDEPSHICGGCQNPILDTTQAFEIEILNQWFHFDCFACRECQGIFNEDLPFVPFQGHAYCDQDYQRLFLSSCAAWFLDFNLAESQLLMEMCGMRLVSLSMRVT